jgi:hypothetical protein
MKGVKKDGSIDLRVLPKIVYRRLINTPHKAYGLSWQFNSIENAIDTETIKEPTIEIDSTLVGRQRLDTEIHEALHLACPWMTEFLVARTATYIARVLWKIGYRVD